MTVNHYTTRRPMTARYDAPSDQADGLRRLFGGGGAAIVPVVANPHVTHHGAMLAQVASAFSSEGLNTLVVDAADTAPEPAELAFLDLAGCVEPLAPQLAYLAARGLPMQSVDTHGSCAKFLPRMMDLVPGIDVLVVHADVRVLCRMLGQRELRPVLIASAETDALTHAYAALKLMTQRLGLFSVDLVCPTARRGQPSPQAIAERVADCADRFLGAALHDWAAVEPHLALGQSAGVDLARLAAGQLELAGWSANPRRLSQPVNAQRGNVQNAPLFA